MVVQLVVVVGANVAAGENFFKVLEERRVDGHDVLKVAVLRAILHHEDFAVALDDLGFDFADLLVEKDFVGQLAVNDLLTNLGDALRTERIGGAGPAKRRLLFLPGLEQRLIGPFGSKRWIRTDTVQLLEDGPGALSCKGHRSLGVFDGFGHLAEISWILRDGLRGVAWPKEVSRCPARTSPVSSIGHRKHDRNRVWLKGEKPNPGGN